MDAIACVGIVAGVFTMLLSEDGNRRYNAFLMTLIAIFVLIAF